MIIKRIKEPGLLSAKKYCLSKQNIFLFTGRKIKILDYDFNCIKIVEGLKNVYSGQVSLDQKSMLLISIENRFYLLSLDNFTLQCYVIKSPFNDNLEGKGCFSKDSKKILIPVQKENEIKSELREFDNPEISRYRTVFTGPFWIIHIQYIIEEDKYLMIASNRQNDSWYLIWLNEYYKVAGQYKIEQFDDAVMGIFVDTLHKKISLFGAEKNISCNYYGKIAENDLNISMRTQTIPNKLSKSGEQFVDELWKNINEPEKQFIEEFCKDFGLDNLSAPEYIRCACFAKDNLMILGTSIGLIVYDYCKKTILGQYDIDYGVDQVDTLPNGKIIVSNMSSVKLFEIS